MVKRVDSCSIRLVVICVAPQHDVDNVRPVSFDVPIELSDVDISMTMVL
jgi:hypothetical protein